MMKTWMSLFIGLSLLLLLTACGSADGAQEAAPTVMAAAELPDGGGVAEQSAAGQPAVAEQPAAVEQAVVVEQDVPAAAGQVQVANAAVALTADYADALSVQGQLAVGMMQLEATEQAVTAEQAAALLPLWQALQALSLSDTTAEVELTAVVNQIADSMTPEQVAAIANMRLTAVQVTAMLENGELGAVGGRGFGGGNGQGGNGQGAGAGMMGGGPSGGLPGGGGPGGLGGGEIDPAMIETRQAEFADNGTAVFQERMLTGVAVRLLEGKMGIVSDAELRRVVMDEAFTAVAQAAELSVADLQAEVANGNTLAAVVTARGGDVAALQAQLVTIFAELPDADQLDLVQAAADWLGQ